MTWDIDRQAVQVARLRMALLFPAVILMLTILALRAQEVFGMASYVGLCCLVLASVLSFTRRYKQFDQMTLLAIGDLDFAAILVIGSLPGASMVGAFLLVPGLWLGGIFRWRGVGFAALMGTVAVVVAETFTLPGDLTTEERILGIAAFVSTALVIAAIMTVWIEQVDRLQRQAHALEAALSALQEEKNRGAAIIQAVDVGLTFMDADGTYVMLNPRATEFAALAYPTGHTDMLGHVGEIYASDNQTRLERTQLPSVRAMSGESVTETLWLGDDKESRCAVTVSIRPVRNSQGTFAGAVIATHDVTTLMRALKVKDDFIATVSHELRTPLTSIIGTLEIASDLDDEDADQLPGILAVASRNANRLYGLISDLLAVSQSDGTQVRTSDACDFSEIVEESVRDVSGAAQQGAVGLTTAIAPRLRLVGDHGRLQQVTDNVLSNAVKYTLPDGQVRVTLTQTRTDIVLTVQDTGIGMSESDQGELFSMFSRGHKAIELALPGVGLGLAISKEIVEAYGGSIELTSSEATGTTVLVRFPFRGRPSTQLAQTLPVERPA